VIGCALVILIVVVSAFYVAMRLHHSDGGSIAASPSVAASPSDKRRLDELLEERQRLLLENANLKLKLRESVKAEPRADAATSAGGGREQPWLIIGIPTVPRRRASSDHDHVPILLRTLESIRNQVFRPTFFSDLGRIDSNGSGDAASSPLPIQVVVMNNRPGQHLAFEQARAKWQRDTPRWVQFLENNAPYPDPPFPNATTESPEFAGRHQEAPTPAVRRQTLDVASLLDAVAGRSRYFLFYEDDFHFCDGAMLHLVNLIERSNFYYGGVDHWSAIRCSYGLAGIVMQNGGGGTPRSAIPPSNNDVAALRDYFLLHSRRRPPDHLAVEFYAKESSAARLHFAAPGVAAADTNGDLAAGLIPRSRRGGGGAANARGRGVVAYRYNILRHDGLRSTLRDEEGWTMPGCFEQLVAPQVFEVEAWNPAQCPKSDIWPCEHEQETEGRLSKEDARRGRGGFADLGEMKTRDA
jgi:hypothetical protein